LTVFLTDFEYDSLLRYGVVSSGRNLLQFRAEYCLHFPGESVKVLLY